MVLGTMGSKDFTLRTGVWAHKQGNGRWAFSLSGSLFIPQLPSPQAFITLVPMNTQFLDFPGGTTDENLPVNSGEGT